MNPMNEEQIKTLLNENVVLLFDVGNSYTYTYRGKIDEVTEDSTTILDRKAGQLILSNSNIIQISKEVQDET